MSYLHKAVQMRATIATMLLLRDEVTLNDSSEGNLIYCIVVARGPIDNNQGLILIMAWRRIGDKPYLDQC